ncbi:MAG: hypothetical protein L6R39_006320 [Caloplaca ligustica]|nr:MAG: hypothetical protein L6R39_006320 [Caloplaca ligustica]
MLRLTTLEFQKGVNEKVNKLEAGQKGMNENVNKLEAGFRKIFDCQAGSATDQRNLLLELGASIQRLLDEPVHQHTLQITEVEHTLASGSATPLTSQVKNPPECELIVSSTDKPDEAYDPESRDTVVSEVSYRRDTLLDTLSLLKTAFTHEIQALLDMTTQASQLMIDAQVQRRLLQWNKDPNNRNLWIQGPYEVSNPSQNTLTAVCLVALSRQNDIPCVFYSCALTPENRGHNAQWSSGRALSDMVKSLAVQLIFLLPEKFISTRNFALDRFERLQHELLDIDDTLDLLQDLRSLVPPYLHCVVSGVQYLEDRDDKQHSRNLLRVLSTLTGQHKQSAEAASHINRNGAPDQAEVSDSLQITKVCFTSDGYVDTLAQLVEQGCLSKVEYSDEAGEQPGEEDVGLMPRWSDDI